MKDFTRSDLLFSLCGLNCGLCPMHLDGHCPGCGGGEGNQSCKIARCSLQHGKPEYCSQCQDFPCEKYEDISTPYYLMPSTSPANPRYKQDVWYNILDIVFRGE